MYGSSLRAASKWSLLFQASSRAFRGISLFAIIVSRAESMMLQHHDRGKEEGGCHALVLSDFRRSAPFHFRIFKVAPQAVLYSFTFRPQPIITEDIVAHLSFAMDFCYIYTAYFSSLAFGSRWRLGCLKIFLRDEFFATRSSPAIRDAA